MSLKLEEIQKRIAQAKAAESQAGKNLAPRAEAAKQAREGLYQAQVAEAEKTLERQKAWVVAEAAAQEEVKAQAALAARQTERVRWEQAFERALEE
jgi:hypothetical protein